MAPFCVLKTEKMHHFGSTLPKYDQYDSICSKKSQNGLMMAPLLDNLSEKMLNPRTLCVLSEKHNKYTTYYHIIYTYRR